MKSKKSILIVLALMIAACLSVAALAEEPAEIAAGTAAADAAKAAAEEAQAAADAAQAESTALTEALEAYSKAKAESRNSCSRTVPVSAGTAEADTAGKVSEKTGWTTPFPAAV